MPMILFKGIATSVAKRKSMNVNWLFKTTMAVTLNFYSNTKTSNQNVNNIRAPITHSIVVFLLHYVCCVFLFRFLFLFVSATQEAYIYAFVRFFRSTTFFSVFVFSKVVCELLSCSVELNRFFLLLETIEPSHMGKAEKN